MENEEELSLAERLLRKKNGSIGFPKKNINNENSSDEDELNSSNRKRRLNKNRPREISSKKPVGRFKEIFQIKKVEWKDPRFDPLCGKLNEDMCKKAYNFLDDYKENELESLKKQFKKAKSQTKKLQIKDEIKYLQQEISEKEKNEKKLEIKRNSRKEERMAIEKGKNPYYLKKRDTKNIMLRARYEELQKNGKLENFLAKKRKKNASKDHRWLPTQRKFT